MSSSVIPVDVSRDDAALERALVKVQAASGALFALFLLAHLFNQMVAAAGPAAYDGLQAGLRAAYQAPVIELVLVAGALVVHVVVSVWRVVRRRLRGRAAARAVRSRLQRWSGVVLLVFTFGHVFATRGASLLYGVNPEFDGIAFSMIWNPAYFIPYYTVFSIAGLYHAMNGLTIALPRLGLRGAGRPGRAVAAATIAGALALVLGVAAFAGAFEPVRERALASGYAKLLDELGLAELDEPAAR